LLDFAGEEHIEILIKLLRIPGYLIYRLGAWWSMQVEERGAMQHDHVHGVELAIPLGRVYEEAVESFIGSWEQLDLREPSGELKAHEDPWVTPARRARFACAHAERTLEFLLDAVARGDTVTALW